MQYFSEQEVASVLSLRALIPVMRQTLIDFSNGDIEQPTRKLLPTPGGGYFAAMTAISPNAVGTKLLNVYPNNAAQGLPTHLAEIALFDPNNGQSLALLDGRLITEMRTAAVTACFVDALTPQEPIGKLAMIGAGVQAHSHLQAVIPLRQFEQVQIWSRNAERSAALAPHFSAEVADSCEQAVRDADVVIVATAASDPVIDGSWLKPGCKLASVGWSGADGCELDAACMQHTVIVDSRAGTTAESGNIRRHDASIRAELGEVLAGKVAIDLDQTVVFDSIGMACEDVAAAAHVYQRLIEE